MRGPWVASEHYYASNISWPANINKYWREALRNASPWETLAGWPDTSARSLEDLSPACFSRQFSYARAKERLCRRANNNNKGPITDHFSSNVLHGLSIFATIQSRLINVSASERHSFIKDPTSVTQLSCPSCIWCTCEASAWKVIR